MKTDWELIRKLMNSTIDACEAVDAENITAHDRDATTDVGGFDVSVWDLMQSAWVYPENLTYSVIRAQHKLNGDKPYTSELARTVSNVGRLCAELVDAPDTTSKVSGVNPHQPGANESVDEMVAQLASWYTSHMVPNVKSAIDTKREGAL